MLCAPINIFIPYIYFKETCRPKLVGCFVQVLCDGRFDFMFLLLMFVFCYCYMACDLEHISCSSCIYNKVMLCYVLFIIKKTIIYSSLIIAFQIMRKNIKNIVYQVLLITRSRMLPIHNEATQQLSKEILPPDSYFIKALYTNTFDLEGTMQAIWRMRHVVKICWHFYEIHDLIIIFNAMGHAN